MAKNDSTRRTLKARFRIQLPAHTWIAAVSRAFPGARFRLLAGIRTATGAIEIGEVRADDPAAVSEAIEAHQSIESHRLLDITADRSLSRYETTESDFYEFVEQSSLAPEYPITVRNGWFEYDLTGTREEFDRFRSGLEESPLSFELVSTVAFVEPAGLLTDRQQQVLDVALREGYFEVPRECTLADVAGTLNVDKSTASETLRRADARIVKWYLTGAKSAPES